MLRNEIGVETHKIQDFCPGIIPINGDTQD